MNRIHKCFAPLLLAALLTPALSQAKGLPDDQAIFETLSRYEAALNAADTASIIDLYTKQGIQMAPDAPVVVGRDAVEAAYSGTFKAVSLNLHFTVDEVKMLSKTSALLRSHSAGTLKVNGSDQPPGAAAFKELFILDKQTDGKWKFSHYSFSATPVRQ